MKKRAFLLTAMTAFILALTACKVAEKTPEGEDTGITRTENDSNDQYYVPLDTDGDGEEDQAIVIIPANGGNGNTSEEDYTPVSEMTFEKRPEIDSDGMFMQYGPILIEFGVSSMEDIKAQIEHSGIPQWKTFGEDASFYGVLDNGLGRVTAGYGGGFSVFFINFEEGNEWGYEPGYRAVYAANSKPYTENEAINSASNDYVWFSDSAAAFFEEHYKEINGYNFNRNDYNFSIIFSPVEDYYGFVPAE